MGKEKYSLSKKIKASVKRAVKFISDFEKTASDLAIENEFDYVVCGHIHQPQIEKKTNAKGSCLYLNSGDWVENLTALEYVNERWNLYVYHPNGYKSRVIEEPVELADDYSSLLSAFSKHSVLKF